MSRFLWLVILPTLIVMTANSPAQADEPLQAKADDHPISKANRNKMRASLDSQIIELSKMIKEKPDQQGYYSRRADAYFFSGDFAASLADYEKMVELNDASGPSHWRRGIARFFAKKYKGAAHQFEIYNSFDDVDRENGIWRYFSQYKAYGKKKAREGLLKYKKDDREPFPSVYKLFSGEIEGDQILKSIRTAKISDDDREKRLFYANLYVGLNHALEGNDKLALPYLKDSTANKWGPKAGYGPNYMWHVGRLHYDLLLEKAKEKAKK